MGIVAPATIASASQIASPSLVPYEATFAIPADARVGTVWTLNLWLQGHLVGSDSGTSGILKVVVPRTKTARKFQADVQRNGKWYSGTRGLLPGRQGGGGHGGGGKGGSGKGGGGKGGSGKNGGGKGGGSHGTGGTGSGSGASGSGSGANGSGGAGGGASNPTPNSSSPSTGGAAAGNPLAALGGRTNVATAGTGGGSPLHLLDPASVPTDPAASAGLLAFTGTGIFLWIMALTGAGLLLFGGRLALRRRARVAR